MAEWGCGECTECPCGCGWALCSVFGEWIEPGDCSDCDYRDDDGKGDPCVTAGTDESEGPRWWVFTFGCGHEHRGRYVRIWGTLEGARSKMVARFGREWAFQYSQEQWDEVIRNLRENGFPHEVEMEVDWDD